MNKVVFVALLIYGVLLALRVIHLNRNEFIISYVVVGIIAAVFNYLTAKNKKIFWGIIGFLFGVYGAILFVVVNFLLNLRLKRN